LVQREKDKSDFDLSYFGRLSSILYNEENNWGSAPDPGVFLGIGGLSPVYI
jgi:hypothetical protein